LACLIIALIVSWFVTYPEKTFQRQEITVQVKGEVSTEKTIQLPLGIKLPGLLNYVELTERADQDFFKQQLPLKDGDIITVPIKKEAEKIAINTAGVSELCQLKGIGPVLAQRIIDYRLQHGVFQKLEDLMNVKGIKEKTFAKIKDFICL